MTSATGDIISPDIIRPQKTIINYSSSLSSLAVFPAAVVVVVISRRRRRRSLGRRRRRRRRRHLGVFSSHYN